MATPVPVAQPQPTATLPNGELAPLPEVQLPVPGAAPAPGLPTSPAGRGVVSGPTPVGVMEPDKVRLEDVRDKLMATRDEMWNFRDRMEYMDLLKQYNTTLQMMNHIQ